MIRAVIVDDETKSREVLKRLLQEVDLDIDIVGEGDSVESGYELITKEKPQLVFLDVEMLDGTGFNMLEKFDQVDFDVIFTTAYDKYAIKASCKQSGAITTTSRQCSPLLIAEPKEFDGTGEYWSPEQTFVAIVANCLLLTFRAIANASKFSWVDIKCDAQGLPCRIVSRQCLCNKRAVRLSEPQRV